VLVVVILLITAVLTRVTSPNGWLTGQPPCWAVPELEINGLLLMGLTVTAPRPKRW